MFKKQLLDNGIRVVTERIPHVRSVSLGVWVNVGSRDEDAVQGGISHFIEHMLFKGTARRTAKDIAIEMDSIGGELNAFTSKEGTTYYVKVLDEHLPMAADLLSDIFIHSVFDLKDIERERKVILEEIKMVEDTPDDLIHELLYETVWKGSKLGQPVLGTKKTVGGIQKADFLDYMKRFYLPGEIVISAAGKFEQDELMGLLNKSFGGIRKRKVPAVKSEPGFRAEVSVRHKKLEQVHICMGAKGKPYSHEDRYGMYALNTLLGSSMSSRLFQEIREKRGLAYSVYSYLTSMKDTGLFTIYAGVSPSKAPSVVRLINKELKKLIKDGVSELELSRVREQLKGNMVLSMEHTYTRMSQLAKQELFLGRHYTLDEILASIEKVDVGQVNRLVRETFGGGGVALTALGPVKKEDIEAGLEGL
ncbi:MAG: insulinase family protein [Nitrospirae bacterium]|nr:insulinase family protein [Nitrospirota bacterium]MBI5694672.1 insulinase family protein [Nitrospirota bacterium]